MISRSLLAGLLKADLEDKVQVGACAFPPTLEQEVLKFSVEYQLASLNRKASNGTVSPEHIKSSLEKFFSIQDDMRDFNENWPQTYSVWSEQLDAARDIVHSLLPPLGLVEDEIWPLCTFGPGTFHGAVKSGPIGYSLHFKIGGDQTVTPRCKYLAVDVIGRYFPNWAQNLASGSSLTCTAGNRLSHVPKDIRACRPIAIEPSLNVFLQQGVGRYLGRLMRQRGFADIYEGQAVQRLKASRLENGTIDLSSASDTISLALCSFLLPPDWWELLRTLRSPSWSFKGQTGDYANVSSQGNAFTFPLETLIFKAIVMAFTGLDKKEVTVYGDDIILPVALCTRAVEGLEVCGFTVNKEKSFYGQHENHFAFFRESCGADYYRGTLVTPVYYREDASSYSAIAALYNRLEEAWGFLPRVSEYLLSCVPAKSRLFGPKEFITDRPENWLSRDNFIRSMGSVNSVVRTYSSWFWSEDETSSHYWTSESRKLTERQFLSERTAVLTFLLGDGNTIPRSGRVRRRRMPPMTPHRMDVPCRPLGGGWKELIKF